MRILYLTDKFQNKTVGLPIVNTAYNLSSRQGLLKHFFRTSDLKPTFLENSYNLILNKESITNFINKLNLSFNYDPFLKLYRNYWTIHISDNFDKYRKDIYQYCLERPNTKFLVVFHTDKYMKDAVWNNLSNITFYTFQNEEEQLLSVSLLDTHVFHHLDDVFFICLLRKFHYQQQTMLKWLCNEDIIKSNKNELLFINNNFTLETIKTDLKPGFSFIIRAKNETRNLELCLTSLLPIVDKFPSCIFVDNNSTDDTFSKAENILSSYSNVRLLKYPIKVPSCGTDHKTIVETHPELSLGNFYRWYYSFSTKYNVIKWDCDF